MVAWAVLVPAFGSPGIEMPPPEAYGPKPRRVPSEDRPGPEWVYDLNGDGRDDLVFMKDDMHSVGWMLGSPKGLTGAVHELPPRETWLIRPSAVGDFDGDGRGDLVYTVVRGDAGGRRIHRCDRATAPRSDGWGPHVVGPQDREGPYLLPRRARDGEQPDGPSGRP